MGFTNSCLKENIGLAQSKGLVEIKQSELSKSKTYKTAPLILKWLHLCQLSQKCIKINVSKENSWFQPPPSLPAIHIFILSIVVLVMTLFMELFELLLFLYNSHIHMQFICNCFWTLPLKSISSMISYHFYHQYSPHR